MDERTVARFWAKVDRRGPDECWPWTAGKFTKTGYGQFSLKRRPRTAHSVAYEWLIGPVPPGLDLDHQCHNRDAGCPGGIACPHRACVNPAHLEPSTRGQNMWRSPQRGAKAHCEKGHPFDAENTRIHPVTGHRRCRTCHRDHSRQYAREKRASDVPTG